MEKLYRWILTKLKFSISVDSKYEENVRSKHFGDPYLRVRVFFGDKLYNTWFVYNEMVKQKIGGYRTELKIKKWKK